MGVEHLMGVPFSVNAFQCFNMKGSLCVVTKGARASGMTEMGETHETMLPMISRWVLRLVQHKQELSSVYQFIAVLYNLDLCSLVVP